ncbi:zinc-binding alcohol dehydrogenase [Staphylococcus agnetis]|uniref:acrylyl-CoA reductase family protein n=1 Tax=Staphylococcus agnetis TaxID=985762 RepID=UPI000DF9FBD0|nr:acryloyl-CoA reductase [Staphylococcus agnetis]SUK08088.1 zinc-binding alcohol dehydrogenase [Staphylococcus agnetis]
MAHSFKAYVLDENNGNVTGQYQTLTVDDLPDGEVIVKVHYSSLNYKDMLATQDHNKIIRHYPMIPGIDLAGKVIESKHPSFKTGDAVIATGYELGVSHAGGFSEMARVKGDWLVPLPKGLTLEEAMIIGTAGFTAAISIQLLEDNKITSDGGPVCVRGATGGVGTMATMMLSALNYKVTASTGQHDKTDWLKSLGAREVIGRLDTLSDKPLQKGQWQAIVDPVGGNTVGECLKYIQPHGAVALSGNVSGMTFESSVFPFILRGVKLLGVDSVQFPMRRRLLLWRRLATDLKPQQLHEIKTVVPFKDIESHIEALKDNRIQGRIVIKMD